MLYLIKTKTFIVNGLDFTIRETKKIKIRWVIGNTS